METRSRASAIGILVAKISSPRFSQPFTSGSFAVRGQIALMANSASLLAKNHMRFLLLPLFLGITSSALAGTSGDFAKSGRILTIEQWSSPEGMAWAIQDHQIVVYRMFDYVNRKDELVATKPITVDQLKAIKDAIKRLPKDAFGYRHLAGLSSHPPLLRLGFQADGAHDLKGIEADGHFPPWIGELVDLVSAASQPEAPITFRHVVSDYRARIEVGDYSPPIHKIELRRYYYGEPKPWWKFWE